MSVSPSSSAGRWPGTRRVAGLADVEGVLAAINAAGTRRGNTAEPLRLVDQANSVAAAPGPARYLPADPQFAPAPFSERAGAV
jgi:hypothetical protein